MMTTPPPRTMTYNERTAAELRERIAADQQRLDTMELRELCNKLFILLQRMDMKHQKATEAKGSDKSALNVESSTPDCTNESSAVSVGLSGVEEGLCDDKNDSEEYPTLAEMAASMGTTEEDLVAYALWSAGIDVHGLADPSD